MKYYYTLIQKYIPDNNGTLLSNYLDKEDIKYRVGAEYVAELVRMGRVSAGNKSNDFVTKYVILTEEENLSLIKLRINDIMVIKNSLPTTIKNAFRRHLKWFIN